MRARLQISAVVFFLITPAIYAICRVFGISCAQQFLHRLPLPILPAKVPEEERVELIFEEFKKLRKKRWLFKSCLARSLLLHEVLVRQSVPVDFLIGVRKRPSFKAHAWVEYNGQPLNAEDVVRSRYTVVEDYTILIGNAFK